MGGWFGEDAGVLVYARDPSRVVELTLDGEGSGRVSTHPWQWYGRARFLSMSMWLLAGQWWCRGRRVRRVVSRWAGGRAISARFEQRAAAGGLWVARARCSPCGVTHALVPSFLLVGRLDVVASVGVAVEAVSGRVSGVRSAAERVDVPHTTARDWVRRFAARAAVLWSGFAALTIELGGDVDTQRRSCTATRWISGVHLIQACGAPTSRRQPTYEPFRTVGRIAPKRRQEA